LISTCLNIITNHGFCDYDFLSSLFLVESTTDSYICILLLLLLLLLLIIIIIIIIINTITISGTGINLFFEYCPLIVRPSIGRVIVQFTLPYYVPVSVSASIRLLLFVLNSESRK